MSITVTCLSCGQKTKAPDSAAGKTGKCPHCGSPVLVPRPDLGIVDAEVVEAEVVEAEIVPSSPSTPPPPSRPSTPPAASPPRTVPPAIIPPAKRRAPEPIEPIGLADASLSVANNPPPDENANRRPCPLCGEMIPSNALKCRFCGEVLDPTLKKQEERKRRKASGSGDDEDMSTGDYVVAIICSGIGCIVGVIWTIQGKRKGTKMLLISFCMAIFWAVVRIVIMAAAGEFENLK